MHLHEETPFKKIYKEELKLSSLSRPQQWKIKLLSWRISRGARNSIFLSKAVNEIKESTLLPQIRIKIRHQRINKRILCMLELWREKIPKSKDKHPKLSEYYRKEDPDKHVQLVNDRLNWLNANKASKCNMFTLTMIGLSRLGFKGLPDKCIKSWKTFCERFPTHTARKKHLVIVVSLRGIM